MKKINSLDINLYIAVAKVIKELRTEKNLSLDQLVERIKPLTTKQTLSRYERACVRMPVQSFISICKGLGEEPKDVWRKIMKEYSNIENNNSTF